MMTMTKFVELYLEMRRSLGFHLHSEGHALLSFACFADARKEHLIFNKTVIEWAGESSTSYQRARRLNLVRGFARYLRAEDSRHEIPPYGIFGKAKKPRPVSYIFKQEEIWKIVAVASQWPTDNQLLPHVYGTLFALLACTGLRISEALNLKCQDITVDGILIRKTKFSKSRIVPLHPTAEVNLQRYMELRKKHASSSENHLFLSSKGRQLQYGVAEWVFKRIIKELGIKPLPGIKKPTLHTLRHTFAVRVLESCSDQLDRIKRNTVALSTYLGHSNISSTYWYLDMTKTLTNNVAEACENLMEGVRK